MEYKDYYQILGLAKDAPQDDVKRAYRKLARKYHPDVSEASDAEERFKEVAEAYQVLKDPEKRAAYDQLDANGKAGDSGFQPPPDWDAGFEFHEGRHTGHTGNTAGAADYSEFFENMFGRGGRFRDGTRPDSGYEGYQARGEDSHAKVFIDLKDAYQGASRSLSLRSAVLGENGRPQLKERSLNVRIPKGVRQGQRIRLKGQGSPGMGGGSAGDLYLEIEFNPHSHFKVDGKDVSIKIPLAPWEAALGSMVQIPTPAGKVDLKIPPGSSSGKRMRLKGRGIPAKIAGDFYITLEIVLPDTLNEAEKSLYLSLQKEAQDFNPRAELEVL